MNEREIEKDFFNFVMTSIKNDIYEAWLKNEQYVYNKGKHLQLLYRYADKCNDNFSVYDDDECKDGEFSVSDIGKGAKKDEDAYLVKSYLAERYLAPGDEGYYIAKRKQEETAAARHVFERSKRSNNYNSYSRFDYRNWEIIKAERGGYAITEEEDTVNYERTSYKKMSYSISEAITKYYDEECDTIYQNHIDSYSSDFIPKTKIEKLEVEKKVRENCNNISRTNNTPPNYYRSTFDLMVEHLQQNGFKFNIVGNQSICFNYNGLNFVCYPNDYADGFSQLVIVLPNISSIEDMKLLNELNMNKSVKFVFNHQNTIDIICSTWIDTTPEMDCLVPILIHNLVDAYTEFNSHIR